MSISGIGSSQAATAFAATSPTSGVGAKFDIDLHDIAGVHFEDELQKGSQRTDQQTALAGFKAEASKTPAQRCRDEVMKEWHVTKESLAAMPPEQAKQMEARVSAEVARRMGADHRGAERTDPTDVAAGPAGQDTKSTLDLLSARAGPTSVSASV